MLEPVVDPEPLYRDHTLDMPEVLWLPPGRVRILGHEPCYVPVDEEVRVKAGIEGVQDLAVALELAGG